MAIILPIIIVGILIVVGIAITVLTLKMAKKHQKQIEIDRKTGKYPEGHFMGLWTALGIPLGMPIGIALGNIALGPAIGVGMGVAIGAAVEAKYRKEGKIRPLTKDEEKMRRKALMWGVGFLLLGMIAGVVVYFVVK